MKKIVFALAAATLILSVPASGQTGAATPLAFSVGPWQKDAAIGIQHKSGGREYLSSAALQSGKHAGEPIALMAVGGAAIILGALMDNDAGPILMVGGTAVGLYGLYLYLR